MKDSKKRLRPDMQYRALLVNIRARYEIINDLQVSIESDFASLETAAFHMRKSIEGIAFGCLVALENGLKTIPRDAQGQWNADRIFIRLLKQPDLVFPEAFKREDPPEGVDPRIRHHIVPNEQANLNVDQVRKIYRRSHKWTHEWNPYIESLSGDFDKHRAELVDDVPKIWNWLLTHMIGIGGRVFLGLLKDGDDQAVRVASAETAQLDPM